MAVQQRPDDWPMQGGEATWRGGLPTLHGARVTLRELRLDDAPALLEHVAKPTVLHYIAPPPSTIQGFQRFVRWTHRERRRGAHVCFGIVQASQTRPVGIIQIWPLEPDFVTAEWGFVLDNAYWATGLFVSGARLALDFAFDVIGVHRLEARAAVENGRGNGVLRKLGASREGVLRNCFECGGSYMDHVMWSILADEWIDLCNTNRRH